ncbi:MAG: hypothetical protein E7300_06600 [Lachnospiraceae bacterium]|nr:hypothetical protein [Lachnospiraceae bacterium]
MSGSTNKKMQEALLKWVIGVGVAFFLLIVLSVIGIVLIMSGDSEEDGPSGTGTAEAGDEGNNADDGGAAGHGSHHANAENVSVGTDAKSATVMIYVNGSDLESEAGEATLDISEMIESGIGENVNVIIQTMGTKRWQDYDISAKTAQTWRIENGGLSLIRDELGQLACTEQSTLSEFIGFCKENYPADRYFFLFWDHGGGPVYGFGYDQWQPEGESLTIAEMAGAFAEHKDVHFDIIGMDCCIMASMETVYAFAPFCKYTLLSEDFESGLGWSYTKWMEELERNPGMSTPLLGKYIVDDIIEENETVEGGDSACMGLFNASTAKSLFAAWKDYAYKNEEALLDTNYSRPHMSRGRMGRGYWDSWGDDASNVTLSDYYISDMLALVESIDKDSEEAKKLKSALKASVAYYGHTSDKNELTGLAVSLPYGDSAFYSQLESVYKEIGLDDEYVDWLARFVSDSDEDYFNYSDFDALWNGWADYESEYGCNISGGNSCEYGYDYDEAEYYGYEDEAEDDWIYDYDSGLWYQYEDDILYLYDDETEDLYYYDEESDEVYIYDDETDDWYLTE